MTGFKVPINDPHLLQLFVRGELYGAVRHDSEAVNPVPSHEAFEAFFLPHPDKTPPDSLVLTI